jgi:hypothetical protein
MKLCHRLHRLEQLWPASGCSACRYRRGRVALVTIRQEPDGSLGLREGEPQPCGVCRDVPEQIIEIVEQVVDSRCSEDANFQGGKS